MSVLTAIRWWLFRRLSELGWWVCPEPHRSTLKATYRFDAELARTLADANSKPPEA